MSSSTDTATEATRLQDRPVAERILAATREQLVASGTRRLRTLEIARAANTTESTVFRHFSSLEVLLERAYDDAWRLVNARIAAAAFTRPLADRPIDNLFADLDTLWACRADREMSDAVLVAVVFMRRRDEILPAGAAMAPEQRRFEDRLLQVCTHIVASCPDVDADEQGVRAKATLLRELVLNYIATVWLTWRLMPVRSDDPTSAEHNLSPDEANMGVLALVSHVVGVQSPDLSARRPAA